MGTHSTQSRPRMRPASAAGLIGLVILASTGVAQAQAPPADPAPATGPWPVAGTPCTAAARACVDLDARHAWLIDAGQVVRGPLPISSGGQGHETPRGDFRVEWKNRHHRSTEFHGAPMPFAVFFAEGGIAFHEGDLRTPSAGCVRLVEADASVFHDFLAVDDKVQVR